MDKTEAVKTAGIRLERIETWGRRTFFATAICAASCAILAGIALYVGSEYLRIRNAVLGVPAKVSSGIGPGSFPGRGMK